MGRKRRKENATKGRVKGGRKAVERRIPHRSALIKRNCPVLAGTKDRKKKTKKKKEGGDKRARNQKNHPSVHEKRKTKYLSRKEKASTIRRSTGPCNG